MTFIKSFLSYQLIIFAVSVVLYFLSGSQHFFMIFCTWFVMANTIRWSIHAVAETVSKRFPSYWERRGPRWACLVVSILVGTALGTVAGLMILGVTLNANYLLFTRTNIVNFFVISLIVGSAATIGRLAYENLKNTIEKQILENQELKQLQTRTQLKALQSKVNPHFLFNTLNTMLNLVYKSPEKVESMILNLSDIYRKVLELPELESIALEEELLLVREYLDIEKIRMGTRLAYSITVEPGLEKIPIPPLLIEPMVENAVIHGISPKPEGGNIAVEVAKALQGKGIKITISDNGVGIGERIFKSGFGIHSTRERLRLIYKGKAEFQIKAAPPQDAEGKTGTGTCVLMEIPNEI